MIFYTIVIIVVLYAYSGPTEDPRNPNCLLWYACWGKSYIDFFLQGKSLWDSMTLYEKKVPPSLACLSPPPSFACLSPPFLPSLPFLPLFLSFSPLSSYPISLTLPSLYLCCNFTYDTKFGSSVDNFLYTSSEVIKKYNQESLKIQSYGEYHWSVCACSTKKKVLQDSSPLKKLSSSIWTYCVDISDIIVDILDTIVFVGITCYNCILRYKLYLWIHLIHLYSLIYLIHIEYKE